MKRDDDATRDDAAAVRLGRLAQGLDGVVDAADDAAGRERMSSARSVASPTPRRWWLPISAAALIAVATFALLFMQRPQRLAYAVSGVALARDGAWLGVASDRGPASLRFSEGTEIELAPGSKSRVAEVTADGAHVVLGSGVLHARVVHRPRARWLVGAGPYSIDVTGTAFDVDWSQGDRLELSLHDGSVIVRGPALHEGIRVVAGQRLVAHAQTGNAELSSLIGTAPALRGGAGIGTAPALRGGAGIGTAPAPQPAHQPEPAAAAAPAPAQDATPASAPPTTAQTPAHVAPSWSDMLTSGNFRGVLTQAEARGIDASLHRVSLADLVALSDAARYAGEQAIARRGLLAQRARFPASAEAHAAAFVLGRLADDQHAPEEALSWYDGYLRESPRGAFAAEALGRKLVVVVNSGDTEAAHAVAKTYLRRFSHGAHAQYAREVLQGP